MSADLMPATPLCATQQESVLDASPRDLRELRVAALSALCACDPDVKVAAVERLAADPPTLDADAALTEPPGLPGRPPQPALVEPKAVPQRALGSPEGRARLLHALAHIEFNAVNLALDAIWRFAGLPADYYRDWLRVAAEEACHFMLLRAHLRKLGADYGDFPAHDGLWQMAERTRGDALARMALVPRTLEARGLDASPQVRARLIGAGDHEAAGIVDIILRDEIGHVAVGNRWYRHLCRERGLDPVAAYAMLAARHDAPRLRPPFNRAARLQAGFDDVELAVLEREAARVGSG
jgi:uncharacterized ferritin-like protein (DUF455 family)